MVVHLWSLPTKKRPSHRPLIALERGELLQQCLIASGPLDWLFVALERPWAEASVRRPGNPRTCSALFWWSSSSGMISHQVLHVGAWGLKELPSRAKLLLNPWSQSRWHFPAINPVVILRAGSLAWNNMCKNVSFFAEACCITTTTKCALFACTLRKTLLQFKHPCYRLYTTINKLLYIYIYIM